MERPAKESSATGSPRKGAGRAIRTPPPTIGGPAVYYSCRQRCWPCWPCWRSGDGRKAAGALPASLASFLVLPVIPSLVSFVSPASPGKKQERLKPSFGPGMLLIEIDRLGDPRAPCAPCTSER